MDHSAVAQFLSTNPHFFEEHAELLGAIKLSSPLLGRAISLQERQMEIMREKYRQLELRLSDLLRLAQENENTITKYQQWTNALLLVKNKNDIPKIVITKCQEIFSLPHASLRLWDVAPEYEKEWFASPVGDDIRVFARGLQTPFCGENKDFEVAGWLQAPINSIAMLPLKANGSVMGLLVLGSPDKARFTATMETHLLSQIANTASAAMACLINNV